MDGQQQQFLLLQRHMKLENNSWKSWVETEVCNLTIADLDIATVASPPEKDVSWES